MTTSAAFTSHRVGRWECVAVDKENLQEQPHDCKTTFEVIGHTYDAAKRLANLVMSDTYGMNNMIVISCIRVGAIYW